MKITTAVRRMVRTLNGQRPGWRCYFDADGHLVHRIYGPEAFGPREDEYEHSFTTYQEPNVVGAPVHRWTYEEVQRSLNEAAEYEAWRASPAGRAAEAAYLAEGYDDILDRYQVTVF